MNLYVGNLIFIQIRVVIVVYITFNSQVEGVDIDVLISKRDRADATRSALEKAASLREKSVPDNLPN